MSEWLHDNIDLRRLDGEFTGIELYMRSASDTRPDTEIKKELFEKHIRSKYYVDFIIDDRMSVIRMWQNELGIPVISANPLAIEF